MWASKAWREPLPLRNPNEIGIRRPWSRRFGVDGFPPAGGLNKEGSPAEIGPEEFRHLENVRWYDPRLVSRGGQLALLGAGQTIGQCILGMIDVAESVNVLVGSDDFTPGSVEQRRIDRYAEDMSPVYLSPAMSPDDDTTDDWPQPLAVYNDTTRARHCFVNFAGKILSYNEQVKQLMKVNFPPLDTPQTLVAENTHFVLEVDMTAYPQVASFVWHYERDLDEASPTFNQLIAVLYMGTVGGQALVLRWDGRNLTQDTVVQLQATTQRVIVSTWGDDIVANINGPMYVRNYNREGLTIGNWDRTVPLSGSVGSFLPTAGRDAFGRPMFTGWGSHQLLYYDPTTNTMIGRALMNGAFGALYAADLEHFDGWLYYLWTETGHPSVPANLGRVDGSFSFTDVWRSFTAETTGWTERILTTGESLFLLLQCTQAPSGPLHPERGGLYQGRVPLDTAVFQEVNAYSLDVIPADMVAI